MTAAAMVAVMIVAAFAVVGMADSGAADNTLNGEKTIMGSETNPYFIDFSNEPDDNKNNKATAQIEFNRSAFTTNAKVDFTCKYSNINITNKSGTENTITLTWKSGAQTFEGNDTNYKVSLQTDKINEGGDYTVEITALTATPAQCYSKFTFTVSITDIVGNNISLPTQTYEFKAYIMAIQTAKEKIELGNAVTPVGDETTFDFEVNYDITAKVTINEEEAAGYFFYATGLPKGISMTVDGHIGGKLSSEVSKGGSFTVYAVSMSGHVIEKNVNYTVGSKVIKGFTVTEKSSGDKDYATKKVGEIINLEITPNKGCTLENLKVTYDGITEDITGPSTLENSIHTASFTCGGTGIVKVSISADINGFSVTKTFTVYVVGEIFNTDLDPEVTN